MKSFKEKLLYSLFFKYIRLLFGIISGATHLSSSLNKVHRGLVKLALSHCGLTTKGVAQIGQALSQNKFMASTLIHLDLSSNIVKDDINVI